MANRFFINPLWQVALFASLLTAKEASCGTLVVMIPTRDGLVVAADSRSTVADGYCDATFKIIELRRRHRIVFSVTGEGLVYPLYDRAPRDSCGYLRAGKPILDIERLVLKSLDIGDRGLDQQEITALARRCSDSVINYRDRFARFRPLEKYGG